jgi:membrane protein YqaA with SNARE-associated domain
MRSHPVLAALLLQAARILTWLRHLGGLGLLPLGVLDNLLIPIPGSMDAVTLLLSANEKRWWPYYAAMATAGSVLGGWVTYQLAAHGGQGRLLRRFPFLRRLDKVYALFARFRFWAVAIPAVLPPPVPIKPSLVAAGAMHYPRDKFLTTLTLSRGLRYSILAWLAAEYGPRRAISGYGVAILVAAAGMGTVVVMIKLLRRHDERVTLR